jgi:hypothetical protein
MLLRASLTSPNLGVALKRWLRHHNLLTDDIVLSLHVAGDVATVALVERRLDPAMREFCLVTLLRNIHGISCWLVDSALPLEGVAFPFAAPNHAAVYPLLFPGPVHFGARHAALSFDARYLACRCGATTRPARAAAAGVVAGGAALQARPAAGAARAHAAAGAAGRSHR